MGLKNALVYSLLGIAVVFFALLLLMIIIRVLVKVVPAKAEKAAPAGSPKAEAKPAIPAPGSAGELALNGVDPKTAAMCMAIVADELGKPLNELRFKYIKECSDEI